MTTFTQEVLDYNQELRQQGFTVNIGPMHGEFNEQTESQLHFVYTKGKEQFELQTVPEPTDYTTWNQLKDWVNEQQENE